MLTIKKLELTSSFCPVQYEGELSDGTFIYARARHSLLTISIGKTLEDAVRRDNEYPHLEFDFCTINDYDTSSPLKVEKMIYAFVDMVEDV